MEIERGGKKCICLSFVLLCWLETSQFVLWYHLYRKVPISTLITTTTQNLISPACISIKIYGSSILPGLMTEEFHLDGGFCVIFELKGGYLSRVGCSWLTHQPHMSTAANIYTFGRLFYAYCLLQWPGCGKGWAVEWLQAWVWAPTEA